MSELIFYGLKTCDTCGTALKDLEAAGRVPRIIDVRDDGIPGDVLATLLAAVGQDALVNRRSTTWRGLDEAERALAATPEGAAVLLAAHPTLMKRPVIRAGETVHVGWGAEVRSALL